MLNDYSIIGGVITNNRVAMCQILSLPFSKIWFFFCPQKSHSRITLCGESTNTQQSVRLISSSPSQITELIRHQSSHRPLIGINKKSQQLQKWKLLKSRQKSASKLKLFLPNDIWNPFDGVLFNEKLHSTPFINNLNSKKVSINSSIYEHIIVQRVSRVNLFHIFLKKW